LTPVGDLLKEVLICPAGHILRIPKAWHIPQPFSLLSVTGRTPLFVCDFSGGWVSFGLGIRPIKPGWKDEETQSSCQKEENDLSTILHWHIQYYRWV
jgi:hypothetical protein